MIAGRGTVVREPSGRRRLRAAGRHAGGYGLLELLVVLLVVMVLLAAALPRAASMVHEYSLRGAAMHMRGLLRQTRARAAAEGRYIGIVFDEVDGHPAYSIYADGNSNGIRRRDIGQGVDVRLREPYRLSETFPGVRYGSLPAGAGEPFFPGLRIGRGRMVSFSPLGSSTTGTLFLGNQYGLVYAVVVMGSTGRVRVARFRGSGWEKL